MGKKDSIKVSFGHNAENVTGSYTHINCGQSNKQILVDFGLIQENISLLKEYQMNAKRPSFKPKDLTYIFLTHSHIDHAGKLPMLTKWGSNAPIIIPEGSKELVKAMLLDSANIMTRDALDLTKKLKKEYEPLSTEEDSYNCIANLVEYPVGEKIELDEDISFQLNWNGHIFKSVSVTLWIKNGSRTRKIVISGDIGNLSVPQKFTESFIPFENCNLLVGESTYAELKRTALPKDKEKDLEKIKAFIETICINQKGRVLIPAFAFGRSPVMLATLYDLFHEDQSFNIPIIYASPLGTKLMDIFLNELPDEQKLYLQKVLSWKNMKIAKNFEQLENEVKSNQPMIIVAPSGMMNAGYSVYVASQLLPHSRDGIMFCGFSAEGSLSRKIKEKKNKTITIDGKSIPARCQVCTLKSFSSHAQYQDLLDVYCNGVFDKIALVHGDYKAKVEFSKVLQKECEKRNKNTKVTAVNNSTTINL